VYLVGDSNAGHFTEGFVKGANAAGYDAVVAAYEGCPFIDLQVEGTVVGAGRCRRFDEQSLGWLSTVNPRPNLVVVGNRPDGYIDVSSKYLAAPRRGAFTNDIEVKRHLWEVAMVRTLQRLASHGVPAVVIEPIPWISTFNPGCAVVLVLHDGCAATIRRVLAERERADALLVDKRAVRAAGVMSSTVDFADAFCTVSTCSTVVRRTIAYQDRDHLSIAGAVMLTARFKKLVATRASG
jgi:hypothetical protein